MQLLADTTRWPGRAAAALLLAALLAGCAVSPPRPRTDGPEANPPAGLARVPDAEPRLETIRSGGPNKPYVVFGRRYVPMTQDQPFAERGLASWYGRKFQGLPTSSGEPYDMYAMTAAHPTVPIPSYVRVRNPANGREVLVRVNDRGPFHPGRIIDLSYTAALKLDLLRGVAPVEIERITYDAIRTGAWRREGDTRYAAASPGAAADAGPGTAGDAMREPKGATPAPTATTPTAPTANEEPAAAAAAAPAAAVAVEATPVGTPAPMAVAPEAGRASIAPHIEPVGTPVAALGSGAASADRAGFWVQLGAFRERDGADSFQRRIAGELAWLRPLLAVFDDASLYRLQAGPYPSRDSARDAAESIRTALQLVPLIVERR